MAVVIRLQGLPVIAGSADIRQYFTGLTIPHGGVHIIGGILGEAFIVFASDEHARRAISRSGGVIQGSRILLFLSSRAEMQYAIEMSHRLAEQEGAQDFVTAMKQGSYVVPSYSVNSVSMNTNGSWYNSSPYYDQSRKNPTCNPTVYLFVCGMPLSVTEKDIRGFFHGLHVSGIVLLKNPQGQITGNGLVKFSSPEEAIKGLKHNKQYMGSRSVDISLATEGQWLAAGGIVGAAGTDDVPKKSPKKSHKKSRGHSRSRSRSPKKYRSRSRSPRRQEFCIHMKNLSYRVEKEDIKKFFKGSELTDDQIKFIYDEKHNRKREAFIVFKKELDYFNALCLHKETLNYCSTYIFPITKKAMLEKLDEFKKKTEQAGRRDRKKNLSNEGSSSSSRRTCLYVRNLPCDARKEDVQKFFKGFDIPSDDIQLLCDNVGMGLGEALVKFKSEEKALKAELLNRKKFLETEVLLRLITEEQMKKLSVNILPELSKRPSRPLDDPGNEQMKKLSVNIMPELSKRPSRPMDDPGNEQIKKLSVNIQPELPERPSWLFNDLGNEQMKKLNVNILPELSERPSRPLDDPGNGQMKKLSVNIMPELSQRPSRALDDPGSFKPVPPVNDLYGRFDTGNRMIGYPEGVFNPQADTRQNVVNMNSFTPVKLQNLPYKVTIDEIIDFFYGYPVLRESFAARTNDDGTEAVIFLKSYEEARAAVQELNDKPIGKRKIRVSFL